jgi:hypothetical protein
MSLEVGNDGKPKKWVERKVAMEDHLRHMVDTLDNLQMQLVDMGPDETVKDSMDHRVMQKKIDDFQAEYKLKRDKYYNFLVVCGLKQQKKNKTVKLASVVAEQAVSSNDPLPTREKLEEDIERWEDPPIAEELEALGMGPRVDTTDALFDAVDDWESLVPQSHKLAVVSQLKNLVAKDIDAGYDVLVEHHVGVLPADKALMKHNTAVSRSDPAVDRFMSLYGSDPVLMKVFQEQMRFRTNVLYGQTQALRGHVPQFPFEHWEEVALDKKTGDLSKLPEFDVQEQLLNGIKMSFPFAESKPEFVTSASHPQMNATRIVASTFTYLNAAKTVRQHLDRNPDSKGVVMDVGAGSFGVERLIMLKGDRRNRDVFVHAMMPNTGNADDLRAEKNLRNNSYLGWNCVSETRVVIKHRLNYCRHTARECDCMRHYDNIQAVAVHAAYYLREADFRNIFKYTNVLQAVVHIPRVGFTIPTDRPEYEWKDGKQFGSVIRCGIAMGREWFTGIQQVVMAPLRAGETTYEHKDIGAIIRNGGFHSSALTSEIEDNHQFDKRMLEYYSRVAMKVGAVATLGALTLTIPLVLKVGLVVAAVGGATVASAVKNASILRSRNLEQPPPWTEYTVTTHVRSSYELKSTGETLVQTVAFKRQPTQQLTPTRTHNLDVDADNVGRVTAMLTMAADAPKSMMQACAVLLRENKPVNLVYDTVKHAKMLTKNFFSAQALDHQPPQQGPVSRWAFICQPYVLALSQLAGWTFIAVSQPHWLLSAAIARRTGSITLGSFLGNLIIVLLPLHLALCLVEWALWAPVQQE